MLILCQQKHDIQLQIQRLALGVREKVAQAVLFWAFLCK